MMRMALIVVCLSTLTVIELVTPSRTKTNAPDPFDQLTVDVSVSPDTLEAADRIEIHHLQDEAPTSAGFTCRTNTATGRDYLSFREFEHRWSRCKR